MSNGRIVLKVGDVEFSGEGEEQWVTAQLEAVFDKLPELLESRSTRRNSNGNGEVSQGDTLNDSSSGETGSTVSLAKYLQQKNATSNQVNRFLATSMWLKGRGKPLTTAAVSQALKENHQTKLSNPADCLNKNVSKGYCEKDGKGFFITPDGIQSLA